MITGRYELAMCSEQGLEGRGFSLQSSRVLSFYLLLIHYSAQESERGSEHNERGDQGEDFSI